MKYKINPVEATVKKYKDRDCGIHALNDTCYGICAGFNNVQSVMDINNECSNSCKELVNSRKRYLHGNNLCAWKTPYKPPIFNDIPKFFPSMLDKYNDVHKAQVACHQLCETYGGSTPLECKEWCDVMADSVRVDNDTKENYVNYDEYKNEHPISFYIGFFIMAILMTIFIASLLLVIFQKK